MAADEDVQYFQFDSDGNMFVYRPGSGFSGPSVRVEPGFDMNEVTNLTQSLSVECDESSSKAQLVGIESEKSEDFSYFEQTSVSLTLVKR